MGTAVGSLSELKIVSCAYYIFNYFQHRLKRKTGVAYLEAYLIWGISAIVVFLALIFIGFIWRSRRMRGFSEDAVQTLGITLVILGIIFGADRVIGYSFIGAGVLLSIVSLLIRRRQGAKSVQ